MTDLAPTLQKYFTAHLIQAMNASPHTIDAYRDTWRMLFAYVFKTTNTAASKVRIEQLDAETIASFLQDLQEHRGNSASTRNARLAALHSFYAYAATCYPDQMGLIARVLAIPVKRHEHTDVTWLNEDEVNALVNAPSAMNKTGRRDRVLFATAITTGMRVSELTGLLWNDVDLSVSAHTVCHGKGRKDRATPLDKATTRVLKHWKEELQAQPASPTFPTRMGTRMSTDAVAQRLEHAVALASTTCPSLGGKNITPHTLRHTTAMRLLHAGVDTAVIALWLGHASTESTQIYLHADMEMKEKALERLKPPEAKSGRYVPRLDQLAFLEGI